MKLRIIIVIFLVLVLGTIGYISTFSLTNIKINGCIMSSEKKVKEALEENTYIKNNTLSVYLKNKLSPVEDIPFVTKYDIEFQDKNSIMVDVYEKSVAGCIEYMESYVYFDREGIVLETSKERFKDVPYIKGLTVKNWQLGEPLPIENKKKFEMILNITQLIEKYKLDIQGIEFSVDGEIVLRHDNIEIELGNGDNLAIQMMNLGNILQTVEGKKGILYMKEYDSDNATASFKVR